jgi:hypothetical protein
MKFLSYSDLTGGSLSELGVTGDFKNLFLGTV